MDGASTEAVELYSAWNRGHDSRPSPFELRGYIYPQGHKTTYAEHYGVRHNDAEPRCRHILLQHGASASAEQQTASIRGFRDRLRATD